MNEQELQVSTSRRDKQARNMTWWNCTSWWNPLLLYTRRHSYYGRWTVYNYDFIEYERTVFCSKSSM